MNRKPPVPPQSANDNAVQKTAAPALRHIAQLLGRLAARDSLQRHLRKSAANDNQATSTEGTEVKQTRPPRP
ncbi:hypothetical protein [Paremcibacter congregatus]|uniref:Uncharacterized protein n=1 Tax=Paremcibacter congregatus TaxID=2043170 RepID=A0A2G4YRY8_9PROT|nr:hypothetical protein [Paremcibacter congregatus]PHZ85078.1 hypothetical protein CRD36_08530 [Paremcibacter congregatus]QDE27972.1 hypothetical protein FIV45_12165 [Paremcibacter congregatus]